MYAIRSYYAFPADLERQFDKYIYTSNIKSTFFINDKTTFVTGINVDYQDNRTDGRGFIIPAFTQTEIGGFAFAKHHFSEESILQFGVRYDYGYLHTEDYYDWFQSPGETNTTWSYLQRATELKKHFSNNSWSIGYNYNPENLSLKINAGVILRIAYIIRSYTKYGGFLKENVFITNEKKIYSQDLDLIFNEKDNIDYIPDED